MNFGSSYRKVWEIGNPLDFNSRHPLNQSVTDDYKQKRTYATAINKHCDVIGFTSTYYSQASGHSWCGLPFLLNCGGPVPRKY